MTYDCSICLNINHASRLHCRTCGTIPAMYSPITIPARFVVDAEDYHFISSVVAHGADRAEHHKTSRSYLRTVPLDYYAS